MEELDDNRMVKIKPKNNKKKYLSADKVITVDEGTAPDKKKMPKKKKTLTQKQLDALQKGRNKRNNNLKVEVPKIEKSEPVKQVVLVDEETDPKPVPAKPAMEQENQADRVDEKYLIKSDIDNLEDIYINKEFQASANNGQGVYTYPTMEFPYSTAQQLNFGM